MEQLITLTDMTGDRQAILRLEINLLTKLSTFMICWQTYDSLNLIMSETLLPTDSALENKCLSHQLIVDHLFIFVYYSNILVIDFLRDHTDNGVFTK